MSYSISARGADNAAALAALADAFDSVVAEQPVYAHAKAGALAAAAAVVNLLPEDETRDVSVGLNGYLSWHGDVEAGEHTFTDAGVNASAGLVEREGGAA